MDSKQLRALAAVAAVAGASMLTACSSEEDQTAYCVDENNNVVDEDYCDTGYNGGGSYFIYYGAFGRSYTSGERLSGGSRIAYNDTAGRSNLGLPSSGKIGGSSSGGFGTSVKGGSGSGSGGGSGKAGGFGGGKSGGGS